MFTDRFKWKIFEKLDTNLIIEFKEKMKWPSY